MKNDNHSGIYKIQNTDNGKIYIGSAINIDSRLGAHRRMLRRGTHHSIKLQRAWDKYGEDSFSFSLVEHVEDSSNLLIREQYWMDLIDSSKTGYNVLPCAGSIFGHKMTNEAKKKMSDSASGKVRSLEHRQNLSKANSGKKMSDESRQKMRDAKLGTTRKPHSEATRAKMSASAMGIRPSQEAKDKMAAAKIGRILSAEVRQNMSNAQKARHKPSQ